MPSDLFDPVDDVTGAANKTTSGDTQYSLKGAFIELDPEKEAG